MSLQDRVRRLEAGRADDMLVIHIIEDGDPLTGEPQNDAIDVAEAAGLTWRRDADESPEAFRERAETEARAAGATTLIVMPASRAAPRPW